MKLGLFTVPLTDRPLREALGYAKSLGCEAVELGAGGYPGRGHCDPDRLLTDSDALEKFRRTVRESGMEISALSCHGNPLHPDEDVAHAHDEDFRNTVRLAAELEVDTVITFSGCPGDSEKSVKPNWVACAWPPDFLEILDWQWNERVTPYWREAAGFAGEHGVRVAIEPHPGFVVYNTETFQCLRDAAGENVGVNLDPSNLLWQQIDPLVCVRELGDSIFHVHAKDVEIEPQNTARNGVLDTKEPAPDSGRSWSFRVPGRGHDREFWHALVRELRAAGYAGAISIEHEDLALEAEEGLELSANFLGDLLDDR
jgi:sugar phosphate isomerase/epimerase